jgi:hypothetical protein
MILEKSYNILLRILEFCCGPTAAAKCCASPNPRLAEEEAELMAGAEGWPWPDLTALLELVAVPACALAAAGACCLCCCRCLPCCWLARRKERRRAALLQEAEHLPLEPAEEEAGCPAGGGYSAPPWPPQHTAPQQWPYPGHPPGYTQQPYNPQLGPQSDYPACPY